MDERYSIERHFAITYAVCHTYIMPLTRTIVYCRVSTDKQADRGVSLDAQQSKAHAYAELCDLDIIEVIIDAGVSAKTLDRPGLERALAGEAYHG
jgi:predicted site-specific integrase-resolvase